MDSDYLTLAAIAVFSIVYGWFFFWFEPRFKRNFPVQFGIITFFSIMLFSYLFQSSCSSNFLCVGTPNIFQHSLYYDLVFLRNGINPVEGHFVVNLMIPIMFFIAFYITKNAYFATMNVLCFGGLHEFLWSVFDIAKYGLPLINVIFTSEVIIMFSFAFYKYRKVYLNKIMLGGTIVYVSFLVIWFVFYGYDVTGFTAKDASVWYWNEYTNIREIISWIIIFSYFVLNLYIHGKQILANEVNMINGRRPSK